jgi:hypothetical protein
MYKPLRSSTLHLIQNCTEAKEALQQWHNGDWTFEDAMMDVVRQLYLANESLRRKYEYIPAHIRKTNLPPTNFF